MRWEDRDIVSYAHLNTSLGNKFIHHNRGRWAHEPTLTTSNKIVGPIQDWILCTLAITWDLVLPNKGTFSRMYVGACAWCVWRWCNTRNISQNIRDQGSRNPSPRPARIWPWHGHPIITKSIGLTFIRSCAPNNAMSYGKAHWYPWIVDLGNNSRYHCINNARWRDETLLVVSFLST